MSTDCCEKFHRAYSGRRAWLARGAILAEPGVRCRVVSSRLLVLVIEREQMHEPFRQYSALVRVETTP